MVLCGFSGFRACSGVFWLFGGVSRGLCVVDLVHFFLIFFVGFVFLLIVVLTWFCLFLFILGLRGTSQVGS